MPQKARIDEAGALHPILIRGIERIAIFKDSQDYLKGFSVFTSLISQPV